DEQAAKYGSRAFIAGNQHARAGPSQAAVALDRIDAQIERGETRQMADPFGDELVERDRVAEAAAGGMWRCRQKTNIRRVTAIDIRVPHAAEDGEVIAMLLQRFQVWRKRVIPATVLREELAGQHAQVVADGKHPPRCTRFRL